MARMTAPVAVTARPDPPETDAPSGRPSPLDELRRSPATFLRRRPHLPLIPLVFVVIVGLKTVDVGKLDLMRSLDASRWQTFRFVTFPNALPFVFAGLDIAIVFGVLGAIVGEFVGSQRGLGNLILQFHTALDIASMFAVLLLLAALGVGLHLVIQVIQRRVIFWAQADHVIGA